MVGFFPTQIMELCLVGYSNKSSHHRFDASDGLLYCPGYFVPGVPCCFLRYLQASSRERTQEVPLEI